MAQGKGKGGLKDLILYVRVPWKSSEGLEHKGVLQTTAGVGIEGLVAGFQVVESLADPEKSLRVLGFIRHP